MVCDAVKPNPPRGLWPSTVNSGRGILAKYRITFTYSLHVVNGGGSVTREVLFMVDYTQPYLRLALFEHSCACLTLTFNFQRTVPLSPSQTLLHFLLSLRRVISFSFLYDGQQWCSLSAYSSRFGFLAMYHNSRRQRCGCGFRRGYS